MSLEAIQPPDWAAPRGYSNGMLAAPGSRMLFIAGQIAWDEEARIVGEGDFAAQFERALANVVAVVRAAGGEPHHLARLTIFVADKAAYESAPAEVGRAYRAVMGKHFPAMSLVEVAALLEPGAMVEIEGTAALPAQL